MWVDANGTAKPIGPETVVLALRTDYETTLYELGRWARTEWCDLSDDLFEWPVTHWAYIPDLPPTREQSVEGGSA